MIRVIAIEFHLYKDHKLAVIQTQNAVVVGKIVGYAFGGEGVVMIQNIRNVQTLKFVLFHI